MRDGTVRCWIPFAPPDGVGTLIAGRGPAELPGLRGATAVGVGERQVCAVTEDGVVACADAGRDLGAVEVLTRSKRSTVRGPRSARSPATDRSGAGVIDPGSPKRCPGGWEMWTGLSPAASATPARGRPGAALRCSGRQRSGNLGADVPEGRLGEVTFAELPPVRDVATSDRHTCAVFEDRVVRCWGRALLGGATPERACFAEQPRTVER